MQGKSLGKIVLHIQLSCGFELLAVRGLKSGWTAKKWGGILSSVDNVSVIVWYSALHNVEYMTEEKFIAFGQNNEFSNILFNFLDNFVK